MAVTVAQITHELGLIERALRTARENLSLGVELARASVSPRVALPGQPDISAHQNQQAGNLLASGVGAILDSYTFMDRLRAGLPDPSVILRPQAKPEPEPVHA
jgi:hypothetical protein